MENIIHNEPFQEGLKKLPDKSVNLIVTSPPYNQGLTTQDKTKELYSDNLPEEEYNQMIETLFTEAYRILKDDGSFFYNYKSDTKGNIVSSAFAHVQKFLNIKRKVNTVDVVTGEVSTKVETLTDFKLGAEIVWKYAGNFDSARTRFPMDYEMVWQLVKTPKFKFIDTGEKLSSLWRINHVMVGTSERMETKSHPCPFPKSLVKKCIEHTTVEGDLVVDPFSGSGTSSVVCKELGRNSIAYEINKKYYDESIIRLNNTKTQKKLLFDF